MLGMANLAATAMKLLEQLLEEARRIRVLLEEQKR